MPGAYKVLIFFLLQELYGLSLLGNIASWQSIAQIFGFFTAIGWCSLILVRVAKAETEKAKIQAFNNLLFMGLVTLAGFCMIIMLAGISMNAQMQALEITAWLCAWSFYQLPRHYLIAQKKYRRALVLDCSIIATSMGCLLIAPIGSISLSLASCMWLGGVTTIALLQKIANLQTPKIGYDSKGIQYGLANLLSGGISLSLVPLATYFSGSDFAGVVSLFLAISGVALLIPRAVSLNQLPKIAQAVARKDKAIAITQKMQGQISASNIATTILCLLIAGFVVYRHHTYLDAWQTAISLTLITLQSSASTQSLVYANILMSHELSKPLLLINITSFCIFITVVTALYMKNPELSYLYICATTLTISVYRLISLKNKAEL